jgi:hypothetical protein
MRIGEPSGYFTGGFFHRRKLRPGRKARFGRHHGPDALRIERPVALVEVAFVGEHLANPLVTEPGPAKASGFFDGFRALFGMGLPAFDFHPRAVLDPVAVARRLELLDQAGPFKLREDPHDLPHRHPELVVAVGEIVAVGSQVPDAETDEQGDARFLRHQMTGEPTGVFDDDDAHPVADDALEQGREPRPPVDRILATDRLVAKGVDDLVPGTLRKAFDVWI